MANFLIATDSSCDLPEAYCAAHGIYPMRMHYELDGEIHTDTMSEEGLQQFYRQMEAGAQVHTSAANVQDYLDFWSTLLPLGLPIIHTTLGSAVSSSFRNAELARQMLLETHPQAQLHVIDSLSGSLGCGMLMVEAVRLRDGGASAAECIAWLEEHRHNVNVFCTTGDLQYLYRGGRVSRAGFVVARALNIWPILTLDPLGELKVTSKCRGKQNTYQTIIRSLGEIAVNPKESTLYMGHSNNLADAKLLAEAAQRELGFRDIFYSYIGSSIGAHTGPGLIALFYFGKKRTES